MNNSDKTITCILGSLASGGAEHQMSMLSKMLYDKGYALTIATFNDLPDHYTIYKQIKRVRIAYGKSSVVKALAIMKYVLFVRTNCIISFGPMLNVYVLTALLLRPHLKVICGERNCIFGKPSIFHKILFHGLYKRASYIVPNSFTQGRYIQEKMPSMKNRIVTIINYTDTNRYLPAPMPVNQVIRIGVFCRFEKQKNFVGFIEMLRQLKASSEVQFTVDWYGNHQFMSDGQNKYYEEGKKKIEEYGLNDIFVIHSATKDVAQLIPTFHVLCLPSLYEGFSNSISEYICCGRPVVCSDVSDNSQMVHEGENGFLFNPQSIDEMENAFLKFFSLTSKQKEEMGRQSRKIAEELFDREKFIESYINLIES